MFLSDRVSVATSRHVLAAARGRLPPARPGLTRRAVNWELSVKAHIARNVDEVVCYCDRL